MEVNRLLGDELSYELHIRNLQTENTVIEKIAEKNVKGRFSKKKIKYCANALHSYFRCSK